MSDRTPPEGADVRTRRVWCSYCRGWCEIEVAREMLGDEESVWWRVTRPAKCLAGRDCRADAEEETEQTWD